MIKINRSSEPNRNPQFNCLTGSNRELIVKILKKNTDNSCSFCCESDVSTGSGAIEHFLPKSNFSTKYCEWTNLFWTCNNCNNTKSNRFYGIGEDNQKGKLKHKPLKFDEGDYKFSNHFDIDSFSGNIIELHKGIKGSEDKYQRELTTIQLFGLNKGERPSVRLREIKAFDENPQSIELAKYRRLTKHFYERKP